MRNALTVTFADGPAEGSELDLNEPLPHRVAVRVEPDGRLVTTLADDPGGILYRLQPARAGAPTYRLAHPTLRESGTGYGGVDEGAAHSHGVPTW